MIFKQNPLQNTWSFSLSFGFRPSFLSADDVVPWFVHAFVTFETAALDTPYKVAVFSGVPRNFVWGGSTNSVENRENGDLGGSGGR